MKKDELYLLAFDFGTESVRGGLFDTEGHLIYTESKNYRTYYPHSGWAEQRPDLWWDSFISVVRNIVQNTGVQPEAIRGLSVDTTSCTMLAIDKQFKPLRNAIIWMDVRAFSQAERIEKTGHNALKYNGYGSVSAEWMPCKALWLKENEPDIYKGSRYICEFQDWINYQLTGKYVGCINEVTIRWYYDSRSGGWPRDFYEQIGIGEVIDKFPPDILELGRPIGKIKPELAKLIGLSTDTMVIQGGGDGYIAMIGLNVVKPGRIAFITGSSHIVIGLTTVDFHGKGIFGTFPDSLIPGLYSVEGGQISTGSILNWFTANYIGSEYVAMAKEAGLSLYDYMSSLAEKIEPGSEGLVLLDYWQGNRTPLTDPQARGVIWGFSLKHTPEHVFRAIMEGVAYGTEHIRRFFSGAGFEATEFYACGGATKSRLWMQIHSDVLGLPIYLPEEPNAPLLGDAILAACGTGIYRSIEEATSKMVRIKARIDPIPKNTEAYKYYVDIYIETYPRLKDLMHDVVKHVSG
ncbi:MAG: xylulose kinase [Spirochaetes bacterium DG_61]|nr:MAG: xylulose kinase [Spirochaetes bacterium DG_61]